MQIKRISKKNMIMKIKRYRIRNDKTCDKITE